MIYSIKSINSIILLIIIYKLPEDRFYDGIFLYNLFVQILFLVSKVVIKVVTAWRKENRFLPPWLLQ